jgi:hypothetical protein
MAGDEHIKPLRLFDIARDSGSALNEQEAQHLRTCEECRRIVIVFARQFGKRAYNPKDAA